MKKIIQRIRIAAALAALCAIGVGNAWAATLSHTGYISNDASNPTAVFSGVALSDIANNKLALSGNLGGGSVTKRGAAGVFNYNIVTDGSSVTSFTAEFQRVDDGWVKCVEVEFTESSGTIYAYAKAAKFVSGSTIPQTSFPNSGTAVANESTAGYGVYDIAIPSLVPIAVWDGASGDFATDTINDVTFDKNNNTVPEDGAYVKIDADGGAIFKLSSGYSYVAAVFSVTNLNESASSDRVLALWAPNNSDYYYSAGVALASGGVATRGIWNNVLWGSDSSYRGSLATSVSADTTRTFVLATEDSKVNNIQNDNGTHLFELTGDDPDTAIFGSGGNNGLRGDQTYNTLVIGGKATQSLGAMTGLVITKVVIYASNTRQFISSTEAGTVNFYEVAETPATKTVAAGETIAASALNSLAPVCVYMGDNATLNLDAALGASVYLYGSVSGTAGGLALGASGYVTVGNVAYLPPVTGLGTISYPDKILPTDTASLTASTWGGTVILNNCGADVSGTSGHGYVNFANYGNANSYIRAPGYKGYTKTDLNCAATLVIESDETFTLTDGNGTTKPYFAKVTGTGTLALAKGRSANTQYVIGDISDFRGTVTLADDIAHSIVLGGSSSWSHNTDYDKKLVIAGSASIASGKTWTASNGIVVNGTLSIGDGATVSAIASGSIGTIQVSSGTGTVLGVSDSAMPANVLIVGETTTLAITDTSIRSLTIPAAYNETYYNAGTLDLSGCTLLKTLYLDLGSSQTFDLSHVTLPATCTTVTLDVASSRSLSGGYSVTKAESGQDNVAIAYAVEETKAEYGAGSLEVSNVPDGATVYVVRPDGTTVAAEVSNGTARLSDYGTIKIDGAATAYDVTFTNTYSAAYGRGAVRVQANGTGDTLYNNSAADKTTGMYLYKTPWIGDGGSNLSDLTNFQNSMTLAVVAQMPYDVSSPAMVIHLGGCQSANGFLIASSSVANEVIVAYNKNHVVTKLTTMTVPNAATTRHVYVITKSDDTTTGKTTFTIYLDGTKWKTVTLDEVLSISGGVQVGSDFHGQIHANDQIDTDGVTTYRVKSICNAFDATHTSEGYVENATAYVNCIRLYDRILTQAEINQYSDSSEYPYVSPNGSSSRTFAAAAEDWVESNETDWENTTSAGVTTAGSSPTAGAAVMVNASAATEITVNLASETQRRNTRH